MSAASLVLAILALTMPQPQLEAEILVFLTEPSPLEFVWGDVDVEAEVQADETIREVELLVDGRSRGKIIGPPPYRWTVDVGDENREHTFEVVARGELGTLGRSKIVTPDIKINEQLDVELQQLYVTVERGREERVLDLGQDEFRIFDNGNQHQLVTFARGDVPLTAAVLVDSSESMKGSRLDAALRGTRAFASGMRELDEAAVMLFSDQLLLATPFTSETEELVAALEGVQAGGNTSVNDHLYLALKRLDARQGRRVVVLFTDGADLHSVLDMEEVLWKAARSQALVYWIRYDDGRGPTAFATAWRNADANTRQLEYLERSVTQSGGRILTISEVDAIEPAFRAILKELREQYVLGYYPRVVKNDGSWHDVKVRVDRSGVKVRTRGGYVD